jgi:tRNA pseudouridine38-40 synthase
MRNIKLTIEYDGTNYHGWQFQPEFNSIQAEVEQAIYKLTQQSVSLTCAGRTDAGVHAIGQVANFQIDTRFTPDIIKKALNFFLPDDIAIRQVEVVPEKFSARFSANYRKYRYVIATTKRVFNRNYSGYCKYRVNLERMHQAAQYLVGEHDFRAFCRVDPDLPHYLCEIHYVIIKKVGDEIWLEFKANRFLHNMVRIITGTLIEVGRGMISPDEIVKIIDSKDRRAAGKTYPARGLFLMEVGYS